ncbi:S9 family peptidase, partial [Fructobacillus ficulneus]
MPGVQVTDLFTLKTISQPQSAGDHTFFVQNEIDQAANGYTANIYSLDDNQQIRQWTNAGLNLQPTVAGNFLYYRSKDSDGQFQLMQMPIDGDVAKQLTTGDSIGQIMLSSNQAELFLKTVHTPTPDSNPFPTRHVTKVQNKADGQGWLPTDNTYTLDRFELTTGKQSTLWTSSHDFNLQDISPSSNQILYLAPTHSEWQNEFDTTQGVFLYDLELDKTELLTSIFATGVFSDAHFSADGQKVMLIGSDYSQYSATVNQLYLYDLKTKHFENITGDSDLDVGYDHGLAADMTQNASHVSGFWLANDQYLFHAYHHGHSQLYLWNGQTCTLLNDDHRDIVDFSVTNAGQIIMATSTPIKPSELKSLSLKTGNEVLLFNPNQNYEKDHTFAPVKSFYYPSTDQKVQLQGWLAEAQTAAAEAPLILYIHGGPHSAYGETFFHEFQALAAKGYHVVYFNPRGSTSYGQNFAADVMGRYGE